MSRTAGVLLALAIVMAPQVVRAQSVLLQIRPHVGDTLGVRLYQQVEMTGTPTGCTPLDSGLQRNTAPVAGQRACIEGTRQMTTRMEVFSRAIIRANTPEGTLVMAVTDSIRTATGGPGRTPDPVRISSSNESVELRISTDGSAEVIDADASSELRTVFGQMPATLSRQRVSVRERWERQMRIPLPGEPRANGLVRTTFQLDSLGRSGDVAYISMRGTLSHGSIDGRASEQSGLLVGTMQLDRKLAWITDMRVTITNESTVRRAGGEPMLVRTKVTQLLKAGVAR